MAFDRPKHFFRVCRVTYLQNLCEPRRFRFAQIQDANHESPKVRKHEIETQPKRFAQTYTALPENAGTIRKAGKQELNQLFFPVFLLSLSRFALACESS